MHQWKAAEPEGRQFLSLTARGELRSLDIEQRNLPTANRPAAQTRGRECEAQTSLGVGRCARARQSVALPWAALSTRRREARAILIHSIRCGGPISTRILQEQAGKASQRAGVKKRLLSLNAVIGKQTRWT